MKTWLMLMIGWVIVVGLNVGKSYANDDQTPTGSGDSSKPSVKFVFTGTNSCEIAGSTVKSLADFLDLVASEKVGGADISLYVFKPKAISGELVGRQSDGKLVYKVATASGKELTFCMPQSEKIDEFLTGQSDDLGEENLTNFKDNPDFTWLDPLKTKAVFVAKIINDSNGIDQIPFVVPYVTDGTSAGGNHQVTADHFLEPLSLKPDDYVHVLDGSNEITIKHVKIKFLGDLVYAIGQNRLSTKDGYGIVFCRGAIRAGFQGILEAIVEDYSRKCSLYVCKNSLDQLIQFAMPPEKPVWDILAKISPDPNETEVYYALPNIMDDVMAVSVARNGYLMINALVKINNGNYAGQTLVWVIQVAAPPAPNPVKP
jgi:hypothetical protein